MTDGEALVVEDDGQRYEVRATGYPKEVESVIGWSNDLHGAERMARAIRRAPGCTSTVIVDRQENLEQPYDLAHENRSLRRELAETKAALDAARKDAERYRYVRARKDADHGSCWISFYKHHENSVPPKSIPVFDTHADYVIDAAKAQEES